MFSLPKSEVPAQCIWSSFALDIFSAFINLYNHLFTSVWAHGYLFYTLFIIQYYIFIVLL